MLALSARVTIDKGTLVPDISTSVSAAYDPIAEFYHRAWDDWYLPAVRPALETLCFSSVRPPARILDVCCGSGHVTRELVARGYDVTGIDISSGLIALAQRELPSATFLVKDVRHFTLETKFACAVCTFDSLNHLLTLDDLKSAFCSIRDCLFPEAVFVFDMNLEQAYRQDLTHWTRYVNEGKIGFVRGFYSPETRRAETELMWFVPDGEKNLYRKHEANVRQQCYTTDEIRNALEAARFSNIEMYTALEAGMTSELGFGRVFFRVRA
jgi:SAM-dependent methyltransferase